MAHRVEPAGGDVHDDVVGAFERLALVGGAGRGHADAADVGDVLDELDHARHRYRVDVLDHDLRVVQQRRVGEVDEQLRRPLVAAATDDRDPHAPSIRHSLRRRVPAPSTSSLLASNSLTALARRRVFQALTSEPALEEGVGAVAVPAVAAFEHVVLQSLGHAERSYTVGESRHLASRARDGEDRVVGAGLDQERARRDERAEVDVLDLAEHPRQHL